MGVQHLKLSRSGSISRVEVELPTSKSLANRALVIAALTDGKVDLQGLSSANDTQVMQRLLSSREEIWDAEDAGTVMRFMTAYAAITGKSVTLTGTHRMKERPLGVLVDALRELGVTIEYLENEGYPPLRISGGPQKRSDYHLLIRGDISSQFISALMMTGPALPGPLTLELVGEVYSRPYLEMTAALMNHFGVSATFEGNKISIPNQNYRPESYTVEKDWSAASYWYLMAALGRFEVLVKGCGEQSLQGDRVVADLFRPIGVETHRTSAGALLKPVPFEQKLQKINFRSCPDLAQTLVVGCAALGVPLEFDGVESLRIKETDRLEALKNELRPMGVEVEEIRSGVFQLKGEFSASKARVRTYKDHRMAMAFAPLIFKLDELIIEDPTVVRKSYPEFWDHLQLAGIRQEEINQSSNPG